MREKSQEEVSSAFFDPLDDETLQVERHVRPFLYFWRYLIFAVKLFFFEGVPDIQLKLDTVKVE